MPCLRREISGIIAVLDAVFGSAAAPSEGAPLHLLFKAIEYEAVLHLQADRTAKRVEPEHRVIAPHIGAIDRVGRDQVPIDRIAKRLVQPDARSEEHTSE